MYPHDDQMDPEEEEWRYQEYAFHLPNWLPEDMPRAWICFWGDLEDTATKVYCKKFDQRMFDQEELIV